MGDAEQIRWEATQRRSHRCRPFPPVLPVLQSGRLPWVLLFVLLLGALSSQSPRPLAAQTTPTSSPDTAQDGGGPVPAGSTVGSPTGTPGVPRANDAPAGRDSDAAPTGFFQIVFQGGWVGLLILLVLLGLSMTACYLAVDHLMTIRASELIPAGLAEQVTQLIAAGQVAEAERLCQQQPSFLAFVLANGLAEIPAGWSAMEKAMEDATAEQAARLFRRVEYLSVIGNIAPMVGLLGTVTGMIFAFQKVATTQGAAGAADLAEGIYQALITTVGGLLVAIPSLGAFAVFRNRVDQLVAEVTYTAQHTFAPWKRRRVRKAVPVRGDHAGGRD